MLKIRLYSFLACFLLFGSTLSLLAQEPAENPEETHPSVRDFNAVRKGSGILDDSTELIYGPTTSRFTYLRDIKLNQVKYATIDTSLHNLERFSVRDRLLNTYQDLGNNGTALWPTFYQIPNNIGVTSGYNSFDLYVYGPDRLRYFDTKSPFIDLDVALGGQGRSHVNFEFSRNVNSRWNVGFNIRRLTSDKQIGALRNEGDRNAEGTNFNIYSFYRSENDKYTSVVSLTKFGHLVKETGGVFVGEDTTRAALFQYRDAIINLRQSRNEDKRTHFHQYHQYKVKEFLEYYIESNWKTQTLSYIDVPSTTSQGYYDQFLIRTDSTIDRMNYKELQNEVGIKGTVGKFFYMAYLKRRDISFAYKFLDPVGRIAENYLGGRLRFDLNENNNLDANIEFLQLGNYKLQATLKNTFFDVGYHSALIKPTLIQNNYFGNHYEWSNNFNNIFANSLTGELKVDFASVRIRPNINLTTIDNYIYFGENKTPEQLVDPILLSTYGIKAWANVSKKVFLEVDARYTLLSAAAENVMNVPKFFANGKIYYQDKWFNNYMPMQLGVNFYYRSDYFGNDYDPITTQFHLQNSFLLDSYLAADVFFNFQVDKVRIFVKMTHINQSASRDGYMVTPFYPGQERIFDLGVRWLFFD